MDILSGFRDIDRLLRNAIRRVSPGSRSRLLRRLAEQGFVSR